MITGGRSCALRALADAGIAVPDEAQVIGFDNIAETEFLVPRLTTIDPDHDFVAEQTVELLVERIHQQDESPPREIVSPMRLVERESTRSRSEQMARR